MHPPAMYDMRVRARKRFNFVCHLALVWSPELLENRRCVRKRLNFEGLAPPMCLLVVFLLWVRFDDFLQMFVIQWRPWGSTNLEPEQNLFGEADLFWPFT